MSPAHPTTGNQAHKVDKLSEQGLSDLNPTSAPDRAQLARVLSFGETVRFPV